MGQPKVTVAQVLLELGRVKVSDLPGFVCDDLSRGVEDKPILVTNVVDNATVVPPGFKYIKSVLVAENVILPPNASGCQCTGRCTHPKFCSCARLNGSKFPYVRRKGGRCGSLKKPRDVLYECGPECGCGPDCINRVSQQGLKYRLEVYRTERKGWAVRSWDFIPSGAPVCEYTGILRTNRDLDNVSENDYIFDIDCLHTMQGLGGRERRQGYAALRANEVEEEVDDSESEFCIDAGSCGNVARFINHSCEPNLFVQCILSSHHDARVARVVLFAANNIPPLEELTYDYGYAINSVIGPDGKIKEMLCLCGTAECRKRLY